MLIQLKSAEFRYGDVTIFQNASLDINEGDSIGLVGANGSGKSTLLSCLAESAALFSGSLFVKNGLKIGYLKQNADFASDRTLFDEMMSVFDYQTGLLSQLDFIASELARADFGSEEYKVLSEKYHRLTVEADAGDAYSCKVKVNTVLNGMGFYAFGDRIVSSLSGGEKTKAALCKLLLQRPELMILDEPTNHLDYKTLDWLENFLVQNKSTLLVVSHDRYFLDKLCTTIWDIQNAEIVAYKGNYSKYKVLKAERVENQRRAYESQQKEIEKLNDYIARNKVRASTADMAKSREKALARITPVSVPKSEERPPRFQFSYSSEPSEFPLTIKKLTLSYDDNVLLKEAELVVRRGRKVALLGLNGTGKSSLIRRIAQQRPDDIGKIIFGKNVRVGYYDQENLNLDGNLRVIDQLWFDNTRMSQTEIRSLLALVGLGADDVFKQVCSLSGGERAKLGLAMIMAKDDNFLLLDEPTNHLDMPSREALEFALKNYTGTVLFVSHDRYFVNSVANEVVELDNGALNSYQGNYDDFLSRKTVSVSEQHKVTSKVTSSFRSAKQRAEQTNRARKVKELETCIGQLENRLKVLSDEMSKVEVVSDYSKLQLVLEEQQRVQNELEKVMAEWGNLID